MLTLTPSWPQRDGWPFGFGNMSALRQQLRELKRLFRCGVEVPVDSGIWDSAHMSESIAHLS